MVYRVGMNRQAFTKGLLTLLVTPLSSLLAWVADSQPVGRPSRATVSRLADLFALIEKRGEVVRIVHIDEVDHRQLLSRLHRDFKRDTIWGAQVQRALAPNQNGNLMLVSDKANYIVNWDREEGVAFSLNREDSALRTFSTYVS